MTIPKKAGRPTTDPATHRPRVTFTLSPEAVRLAAQLATRWGDSKSGAVERAIREAAEREQVK